MLSSRQGDPMQVQSVSFYNPKFKSAKFRSFGDDDVISQARRNYIREHFNETALPYYNNDLYNGRLEEYELNKLIASLCGQKINQDSCISICESIKHVKPILNNAKLQTSKNSIDEARLEKLNLFNFATVSEKLGVYRGQSIQGNKNFLQQFKDAGIERIVDLAGYVELEENCSDFDIEYFYYPTTPYFFTKTTLFKTEEDIKSRYITQEEMLGNNGNQTSAFIEKMLECWRNTLKTDIDDFVKFIQMMQKGKLYIGCQFGSYTTDNALMLNANFNPLYLRGQKYITLYNKRFTNRFINLYNNLTDEHKQLIGWTKEIDAFILKRLKTYIR